MFDNQVYPLSGPSQRLVTTSGMILNCCSLAVTVNSFNSDALLRFLLVEAVYALVFLSVCLFYLWFGSGVTVLDQTYNIWHYWSFGRRWAPYTLGTDRYPDPKYIPFVWSCCYVVFGLCIVCFKSMEPLSFYSPADTHSYFLAYLFLLLFFLLLLLFRFFIIYFALVLSPMFHHSLNGL